MAANNSENVRGSVPPARALHAFQEQMGTEMVDLYVGSEKIHFRVHKNMVCKIDYFHKMFHGGFTEASSSSADFPDDNSVSFDVLLNWIYHGTLRPLVIINTVKSSQNSTWETHDTNWDIAKTYGLAEKLCLPKLQDLIMSTALIWHRASSLIPATNSISTAYQQTPKNSPMRRLMVRTFAWIILKCNEEAFSTASLHNLLKKHDDLSLDYLTHMRNESLVQHPTSYSNCEYHCHGKDGACIDKLGSNQK